LGIALENTSAAESQIRDTDFAAETASMTRAQILSQAATQALRLANSQPQQVLALLA
jgi:flagellin